MYHTWWQRIQWYTTDFILYTFEYERGCFVLIAACILGVLSVALYTHFK